MPQCEVTGTGFVCTYPLLASCVSLQGPGPMHSFSEWKKILQTRYTTQSVLCAMINQLQEALVKMRERKNHYKNESVSLSGSLSDNVDDLKKANQIIKELEKGVTRLPSLLALTRTLSFVLTLNKNQSCQPSFCSAFLNRWFWQC